MFDQVEETAPIGPIPRKKKFHGRVLERRTKKKGVGQRERNCPEGPVAIYPTRSSRAGRVSYKANSFHSLNSL